MLDVQIGNNVVIGTGKEIHINISWETKKERKCYPHEEEGS